MPEHPRDVVELVPDWICEIVSPGPAFKECKDSPQRRGVRRAAKAPLLQADPCVGAGRRRSPLAGDPANDASGADASAAPFPGERL